MLAQLAAVHPDIIESGGDVIGIAPAAPYQAVALEEGSIPFPLFMDPDRALSTHLDVGTQSLANFAFNVKGWGRYGTALLRNRKQGAVTGGYETLPAVAVVDADANVRYLYRGTAIADYPPLTTILAELDDVIDDAH